MQVYKMFEPESKFYLLIISKIKDPELLMEHEEHFYALNEDEPVGKYFFHLWDDVVCEPSTISAKQFLEITEKSGAGYDSVKSEIYCMNVSNEFEKHIVVPKPRWRGKKDPNAPPAEPKQPKPKATPKPKGKKSAPINIQDNGRVDFN